MSQTIIRSLKSQNAFLQREIESHSHAIDSLSQQLADALNRLKQYEPEFVAALVGEERHQQTPVVVTDGDPADAV